MIRYLLGFLYPVSRLISSAVFEKVWKLVSYMHNYWTQLKAFSEDDMCRCDMLIVLQREVFGCRNVRCNHIFHFCYFRNKR